MFLFTALLFGQGMLHVTKWDMLAFATLWYLVWVLLPNLINPILLSHARLKIQTCIMTLGLISDNKYGLNKHILEIYGNSNSEFN